MERERDRGSDRGRRRRRGAARLRTTTASQPRPPPATPRQRHAPATPRPLAVAPPSVRRGTRSAAEHSERVRSKGRSRYRSRPPRGPGAEGVGGGGVSSLRRRHVRAAAGTRMVSAGGRAGRHRVAPAGTEHRPRRRPPLPSPAPSAGPAVGRARRGAGTGQAARGGGAQGRGWRRTGGAVPVAAAGGGPAAGLGPAGRAGQGRAPRRD